MRVALVTVCLPVAPVSLRRERNIFGW